MFRTTIEGRRRRTAARAVTSATSVVLCAAVALTTAPACMPQLRAAVSLRIKRAPKTPADAFVTIDEEFIGPLAYVAAHGVRLPAGTHRITIERTGYFPYDTTVTADNTPINLDVQLTPIPD